MSSPAATPPTPQPKANARSETARQWFYDFLWQELTPYPGRVSTAARMVIAVTLTMLIIMTFHLPAGGGAQQYAPAVDPRGHLRRCARTSRGSHLDEWSAGGVMRRRVTDLSRGGQLEPADRQRLRDLARVIAAQADALQAMPEVATIGSASVPSCKGGELPSTRLRLLPELERSVSVLAGAGTHACHAACNALDLSGRNCAVRVRPFSRSDA